MTSLPSRLRAMVAFDEKFKGDQKQVDELRFHRRADELICGWSLLTGVAFTEAQLNSLVDMLGDDFKAQAVKIHAHGVRAGKALEHARLAPLLNLLPSLIEKADVVCRDHDLVSADSSAKIADLLYVLFEIDQAVPK